MTTSSRLRVYPKLGRVSNLPTIATQTAAGVAIAGGQPDVSDVLAVGGGLAAAYVGGMFLNDAFDKDIDARERPERPIPSGKVSAQEVFIAGGALLACSIVLFVLAGARRGYGASALCASATLAVAIVLYDVHHKGNPFAPMIMGACRGLVYVCAAAAIVGHLPRASFVAALAMGAYVTGLSEVAKPGGRLDRAAVALLAAPLLLGFEIASSSQTALALPALLLLAVAQALRVAGRGERDDATVLLLASMSLVDATLLAAAGHPLLALAAAATPPLTRALQKLVRGT